jgi:2-C-methyl-D-erythritol 2,4-cyclodiphosphate synthase
MPIRVGIGHDSHRFSRDPAKRFVIGGVEISGTPGMVANSDGDVIFHALCNALATITGFSVLGDYADELCRQGVTDSAVYLTEAISRLSGYRIASVSVSVECKRPRLSKHLDVMRGRIGEILGVEPERIAIAVTSGDEMTSFGEGRGIQAFAAVTAVNEVLWPED